MKTEQAIELAEQIVALLKPDPYEHLKAAHVAGKVIQARNKFSAEWRDVPSPGWYSDYEWRVKPEPAWQLPPPPQGREWHRSDWTQDRLPDGYRPLMLGEPRQDDDEFLRNGTWVKVRSLAEADRRFNCKSHNALHRTTRPIPHRWQREKDAFEAGKRGQRRYRFKVTREWSAWHSWQTTQCSDWNDPDCEFRISAEPVMVPLEASDVPPGSVLQISDHEWCSIVRVNMNSVIAIASAGSTQLISFSDLKEQKWRILRKGSPIWMPCEKPAPRGEEGK